MQTISFAPGYLFPPNIPLTLAAFRKLPSISISGSVATGDLASAALTPAKVSPGAYWYGAGVYNAPSQTYNITLDPALTAYANGVVFSFKGDAANGGNTLVNVNALGIKKLLQCGGAELEAGDIAANQIVECRYNSSLDGGNGAVEVMSPMRRRAEVIATDTGVANAYVIAPSPAFTAAGQVLNRLFGFKAATTNTGTSTINISGLGLVTLKRFGDRRLNPGDIRAGEIYWCLYDGGFVQVLNPSMGSALNASVLFDGTVIEKTVAAAVDTGTERLTVNAHGIPAATAKDQATAVILFEGAASTLPVGTVENTTYWAFRVDANTLSLHTSPQGAVDGVTGLVDLTGNGVGANIKLAYVLIGERYNVSGVVPQADPAANAIDVGVYKCHFVESFANGSYRMAWTAKNTAANNFTVVKVPTDSGSASYKAIHLLNQAGTAVASTEVHLLFTGTPAA